MNYRTTGDISDFETAYGHQVAASVRNQLSFLYGRAAGVEPTNWESRLYDNGLVALAPVAGTSELQKLFDQVNLGEAFCKAIGRASEVLAHQDEDSEALDILQALAPKAEQLAAAA